MGRGATIVGSRLLAIWTVGGALAFGQSAKQPASPQDETAPQAPAAAAPGVELDDLLAKWEGQSSKLTTLDVVIFRTDVTPAWDEVEFYEGRALFKAPNLAFIDFKKIKQDDKNKPLRKDDKTWDSTHEERIICTGSEVWQYKSDTKQIFIFPLEKDQAAKAVEEGPLPFLFNMKAEDAKRRYDMVMGESKDETMYNINIKPKLDVDSESFSRASIWLDRSYMLPVRIVLYSPEGKSYKDFKLGPIKPNKPVTDANFEGKEFDKWKVVRNPMANERPADAAAAAAARPAGPRPAGTPAAARGAASAAPRR